MWEARRQVDEMTGWPDTNHRLGPPTTHGLMPWNPYARNGHSRRRRHCPAWLLPLCVRSPIPL